MNSELPAKKDELQKTLTELGTDPEKEQLKKQVIYMMKLYESVFAIAEHERKTLITALEETQKNARKMQARLLESKWGRFKLFIKKILIGKGWYEASSEELQLIHEQNHGAPN